MKKWSSENLTFFAAFLGLFVGIFFPEFSKNFSIFGEIFIRLLKMMMVPLVFVSIFLALARQSSFKNLSQMGGWTGLYFLITTMIAAATGFLVSFLLPKSIETGSHLSTSFLNISQSGFDSSRLEEASIKNIILSFIPHNPFQAFAQGEVLQVIVFSFFMGCATLSLQGKKKEIVLVFFESLHEMVMTIVQWVIKIAPLGVFSLMATLMSTFTFQELRGCLWFFAAVSVAIVFHMGVSLPLIGYGVGGFHPYRFLWNVKEVLLVAFSTASSSATLPISTKVLEEKEKINPMVTGFVLPMGATLNMDGSALYQALVVIFLGSLAGVDFSLAHQFYIFIFVIFSSAGTAGIPGGGLVMMGALLQFVGIPVEYIGIYILVDRVWDPFVTVVNVTGDLYGAKIIQKYLT